MHEKTTTDIFNFTKLLVIFYSLAPKTCQQIDILCNVIENVSFDIATDEYERKAFRNCKICDKASQKSYN